MRVLWTVLALLLALLLQTGLSLLFPDKARLFDPFMLLIIYCALSFGETHGMLAGVAAGWIQDAHFGGRVLGIGGLVKCVLGFAVGLIGNRFVVTGVASRAAVVFLATLLDALLFEWLTAAFDVPTHTLSLRTLVIRAGLNALVGTLAFPLIDRRRAGHERL